MPPEFAPEQHLPGWNSALGAGQSHVQGQTLPGFFPLSPLSSCTQNRDFAPGRALSLQPAPSPSPPKLLLPPLQKLSRDW